MLAPLGLAAGPVVPCREWRELYSALNCGAVAAIHPFYTAAIREFEAAGKPIVGSAPVGYDGTAAWLAAIGDAFGVAAEKVAAAQNAFLPAIKGALAGAPIKGTITVSGYEGSEPIVARLLIESGAHVPYVGSACPKTKWAQADVDWLEAPGTTVNFRDSLEDDCAAMAAPSDGPGRGRFPRAGRERRHRQQRPYGRDEGVLRRRGRGRHRWRLGRHTQPQARLPGDACQKARETGQGQAGGGDDLMSLSSTQEAAC